MKLLEGSINNWDDLEKLILTRFFEDDAEITMPTLLAMRQRKGESVKAFVERFQNIRCFGGMTQATLVEIWRHNLQTSHYTWKSTSSNATFPSAMIRCLKHHVRSLANDYNAKRFLGGNPSFLTYFYYISIFNFL